MQIEDSASENEKPRPKPGFELGAEEQLALSTRSLGQSPASLNRTLRRRGCFPLSRPPQNRDRFHTHKEIDDNAHMNLHVQG